MKLKKIFFYLFIFILSIKFLESLFIYKHVDALNYHIVIAKYITNGLWTKAWTNIPGSLMSGYFEFIYIIPHLVFDFGIKAHALSQSFHFIFSIGITSLFFFNLFKKTNYLLGIIAAISILTISKGSSFFLYAKNDGALAFVFLLTVFYFKKILDSPSITKKQAIIFGLLLGLNPAIKQNGIIFILPFVIFYCYSQKKSPYNIFLSGLFSLLIWSPIILRNWYYFDSALFPGGLSLTPGKATPEIIRFYSASMNNPTTLLSALENVKIFFLGKVIFLISPFIAYLNYKKAFFKNNIIFLLLLSCLGILIALNGGKTTHRFQFPLFFALSFFVFQSINDLNIKRKTFIFILLFLVLIDSKIDKSISRVKQMVGTYLNNDSFSIVKNRIPYTNLWNTFKKSDKDIFIYSDYLSQSYYMPLNYHNHQVEHIPDAYSIFSCRTENDFNNLKKYSYALITRNIQNRCYEKIKKGKLIKTVDGTSLYDIRFIN